jgi:hypothetical protein
MPFYPHLNSGIIRPLMLLMLSYKDKDLVFFSSFSGVSISDFNCDILLCFMLWSLNDSNYNGHCKTQLIYYMLCYKKLKVYKTSNAD